jgi:hypothetical protein
MLTLRAAAPDDIDAIADVGYRGWLAVAGGASRGPGACAC